MSPKTDAYAALKIKDFRSFISGRFLLTFATQMQSIVVGWQVYELTKDPLSLGLVGLAEAIPFLTIALYAGHLADVAKRKTVILLTNILLILCSAAFCLFNFFIDNIFKSYGAMPIFIVMIFVGLSRGMIYPSIMGLLAQLVPKELYPNSSTWNSLIWHIAAVSGPAIGGLIYGYFGVGSAYLGVLAVYSLSFIFFAYTKSRPKPINADSDNIYKSLKEGLKFVFKNQIILSSMALDMFAVLFGGAVAMLPVFASEILKVGPEGLGLLRAAPATGAVLMSFALAHRPPLTNTGKKMMYAIAGFGLCIICFALSQNFYLSLFLLFLSGILDNVSVVVRQTIMQLYTPDAMRGRVASVNSIFIGSSNEIGAFESGAAARIMGLVPSVIFGGSMTLLIVYITSKLAPKLKKLEFNKTDN